MTVTIHNAHDIILSVDDKEQSIDFHTKNPVTGKLEVAFSVGGDKEQLLSFTKRMERKIHSGMNTHD